MDTKDINPKIDEKSVIELPTMSDVSGKVMEPNEGNLTSNDVMKRSTTRRSSLTEDKIELFMTTESAAIAIQRIYRYFYYKNRERENS